MKKFNVYVTRRIPEEGLRVLREAVGDFDMNPRNRALDRKELLRRVKGRDGVLCLLNDRIDVQVMDAAGPGIRIFSNYAVGFDNVDVPEATRRKILISNTPGVLTEATAELAWALLLAAARRVAESDRFTRAGKFKGWDPLLFLGPAVAGKTLGVVGAGRIGSAFALMSAGFKMKVLYSGRSRNEMLEEKLGARKTALDELLRESDFVSLHVSLNREIAGLIGARELALMKPGAVLVNTSRGPVVDERALVRALKAKKIFGAGLDVYEREPELAAGLAALPNAVLAPHIGSATVESRGRMAILAAENLIAALQGERPRHLVNPEAWAPAEKM